MAELLCLTVSFNFGFCSLDTNQWTHYEHLALLNAVDPLPVYLGGRYAE